MYTAAVLQALMWFSTNDEGLLEYPNFLETVIGLVPLYWVRLVGGTCIFVVRSYVYTT